MNPSETSFLVLGLVLGTAIGVGLWQAVRAGSAPRREVRLTITPNAVPARRASTLATPGGHRDQGPLPGSPDGDARVHEPSATARPVATSSPVAVAGASGTTQARTSVLNTPFAIPANAVAVPIVVSEVPAFAPSRPKAIPASPLPARASATSASATALRSAGAVAVLEPPTTQVRRPAAMVERTGEPGGPGSDSTSGVPAADACIDERRLVEERCAVADAARKEARRTADVLRDAQRAYDALQERVDRAQEVADPRRVAEAKAHLHATFRKANDAAAGPEHAEVAAREWLDAINRLNAAVRDAARLVEIGGAELRVQVAALDRLGLDADAARIGADNAAEACQAAREGLAACEEAVARAEAAVPAAPTEPEEEHPFARVWPVEEPALMPSLAAPGSVGVSSIIRVLRGDRDARERIVAALAGSDPDAQREWHLRLVNLVDAITAKAIEDGYLDLPADDPFWGLFEGRETRDVVGALSALGFRYDGMGGFADGRVPATRDLALAVGFAGLDRMRIRTWPREDTMDGLYARATVAADEWLVTLAGDLTLGRMVDALGSRAAGLADTWNAWGRVRPVLLAE